jgi:hypothetical protein
VGGCGGEGIKSTCQVVVGLLRIVCLSRFSLIMCRRGFQAVLFQPHFSQSATAFSKTKCKAAVELITCYAFTVQHLITKSAVPLEACVH